MSKEDYGERSFKSGLEIGYNNKRIIPLIKNWCKHVVLDDISGGMLTEMYNVPTNVVIKCPHTTAAWSGMQLEANARDFIIDNCISCRFHEQVHINNLGITILEEHERLQNEKCKKSEEEQQRKKLLKEEAESLIASEKTTYGITRLSVLSLVQLLDDPDNQVETSLKILEASKLKPEYFSSASLDYLSMHIDEEKGVNVLNTVLILQKCHITLSDFTVNNLLLAVKDNINADLTAGILALYYGDDQLFLKNGLLKTILSNCIYYRPYGFGGDHEGQYPHSISIYSRLAEINQPLFHELLTEGIISDDDVIRINTNGFLLDINSVRPGVIGSFTPSLIKSFELTDRVSGDSADSRVRLTLRSIYIKDPALVINEIEIQYPKLSDSAQLEILDLYEDILTDDETFILNEERHSKHIAEELLKILLANSPGKKVQDKLPEIVKDIVKARPSMFIGHFEILLGFLIKVIQDRLTLDWYKKDLGSQDKPSTTFNPIAGKSYIEIQLQEMDLDKKLRNAESILAQLIKIEPDKFHLQIISSISNLDSKKDGLLKCRLIDLLKSSVKDAIILSYMLPEVYKFLYDQDNESVRDSGVKFVIHLIDNFPEIVTQTFIDTIKIFLNDQVILIRGRAIGAYGSIIRNFPEQNDGASIAVIQSGLTNKYVFIQKSAARISYSIYPFLDDAQREIWVTQLVNQESYYYKDKEFDYCEELVNILLFYTKGNPVYYRNVVNKILVKYCDSKEYYIDKKFVEKLTYIAEEKPEFDEQWLKCALGFLTRTQPAQFSSDSGERNELINRMYKISNHIIQANKSLLIKFVKNRIENALFQDVLNFYGILAFFQLWEDLKLLTIYFQKRVPGNASNSFVNNINEMTIRITDTELAVSRNKLSKSLINRLAGL